MGEVNHQTACKLGLNLTSEQLIILQYIDDQLNDPKIAKVKTDNILHVPIDKELFLREHVYFKDKSTQWFSSVLRQLIQMELVHRTEKESNRFGVTKLYRKLGKSVDPEEARKKLRKAKEWLEGELIVWLSEGKNSVKYPEAMIQDFMDYWCEPIIGKGTNRVLRYETMDAFGIGRRLATWKKNNHYSSGPQPQTQSDFEMKERSYE